MLYGFCSKIHTLSSNAKSENRLRFDEVTESIKVGTFEMQCINFIPMQVASTSSQYLGQVHVSRSLDLVYINTKSVSVCPQW